MILITEEQHARDIVKHITLEMLGCVRDITLEESFVRILNNEMILKESGANVYYGLSDILIDNDNDIFIDND